ncbi:hypothetical protein [Vibrio marisflavi]|uniref:Uncharacterized protein n=1 Tax=Vibrio marisflavi CECT 7928 TaxID=634439 RepID=A0ABN8E7U3_9VIBR|nr:hypothetical protein [Vibrio marisflavi]CAH0539601.1 hypothetical protein VMF7928_02276 [Vibrio marisflavi CECT 7928]
MPILEDIEEWKQQIDWGLKEKPLGGDIVRHNIAIPIGTNSPDDMNSTQSALKAYFEDKGYLIEIKDEEPEKFSIVISKKPA